MVRKTLILGVTYGICNHALEFQFTDCVTYGTRGPGSGSRQQHLACSEVVWKRLAVFQCLGRGSLALSSHCYLVTLL